MTVDIIELMTHPFDHSDVWFKLNTQFMYQSLHLVLLFRVTTSFGANMKTICKYFCLAYEDLASLCHGKQTKSVDPSSL